MKKINILILVIVLVFSNIPMKTAHASSFSTRTRGEQTNIYMFGDKNSFIRVKMSEKITLAYENKDPFFDIPSLRRLKLKKQNKKIIKLLKHIYQFFERLK